MKRRREAGLCVDAKLRARDHVQQGFDDLEAASNCRREAASGARFKSRRMCNRGLSQVGQVSLEPDARDSFGLRDSLCGVVWRWLDHKVILWL